MTKNFQLTICIPTYNSEKYIGKCLNSIRKQTFQDFIIHIADGDSNDSTLEIIKKSCFNYKIISKKDNGNIDAANKLFASVRTDYFSLICSDDYLGNKNYFKYLFESIVKSKADIVCSCVAEVSNGKIKISKQDDNINNLSYKFNFSLAGFLAKKNVSKMGKFNTNYKVACDYDYALRLHKKGFNFFRDDRAIYNFRIGGISYKNAYLGFAECKNIALKYNGPKLKIYFQYFKSVLKFFIKHKCLKKLFSIKIN
jgi:glycosyltransferase involved in cell wall biosynthesis